MEIVTFLGSVNKLSLVAFIFTLGILIYEIRLLKKEKLLRAKPKIPRFDSSVSPQINQTAVMSTNNKNRISKPNNFIIFVLIFLLTIFGIGAAFGFSNYQKLIQPGPSPTPIVNLLKSSGIKIFDDDFKILTDTQLGELSSGDEIIVGIETVKDTDIDRARIRINRSQWEDSDTTVDFSNEYQIYFRKHKIATDSSQLKIDAQLHSVSDGWLGE